MRGEDWQDELESDYTGLEASCVDGLAFLLTALVKGLQRLAFGWVPHV